MKKCEQNVKCKVVPKPICCPESCNNGSLIILILFILLAIIIGGVSYI